jgi:isoleucyl-tRNA synthetase
MNDLLRVRAIVLSLLEQARRAKQLRSSLEAEVDLIVPNKIEESGKVFLGLLQREGDLASQSNLIIKLTLHS